MISIIANSRAKLTNYLLTNLKSILYTAFNTTITDIIGVADIIGVKPKGKWRPKFKHALRSLKSNQENCFTWPCNTLKIAIQKKKKKKQHQIYYILNLWFTYTTIHYHSLTFCTYPKIRLDWNQYTGTLT